MKNLQGVCCRPMALLAQHDSCLSSWCFEGRTDSLAQDLSQSAGDGRLVSISSGTEEVGWRLMMSLPLFQYQSMRVAGG